MIVNNVTEQFCLGENDITGDFYAQQDADCIRYWTHGEADSICLAEVKRSREDLDSETYNLWQLTSSDVWIFTDEELDMCTGSPIELIQHAANNRGGTVVIYS